MVFSTQKKWILTQKYNKMKKLGSAHKVVFFVSRKSRVIIQGVKFMKISYMAAFFYYESYIGFVVKWKRHNGGLVLKNLI